MADYARARRTMVENQIRTADVTDLRILSVLLEVPREAYVPPARRPIAYLDENVPLNASGRALLKPMVFAKLLQAAAIGETDRVLDVGCATGYSTAVLSRLAASVVALEEDAALARMAADTLAQSGARNVSFATGPLTAGSAAAGPFDVIMLEGATEVRPDSLIAQLKEGGRLVTILSAGPAGKAMIYAMTGGHVTAQPLFNAAAPVLPGFVKPAEFVF